MPLSCSNFNTSHVSINHWIVEVTVLKFLISIHPMFLLIFTYGKKQNKHNAISIHPMFLLIALLAWKLTNLTKISIHPMFLLIYKEVRKNQPRYGISIHPMFLLILNTTNGTIAKRDFNTSHVSINPRSATYFNSPYFYFNTSHVSINRNALW